MRTRIEIEEIIKNQKPMEPQEKLDKIRNDIEALLIPDGAVGRFDGKYYIDTPGQKEAWNYTINEVLKIINNYYFKEYD